MRLWTCEEITSVSGQDVFVIVLWKNKYFVAFVVIDASLPLDAIFPPLCNFAVRLLLPHVALLGGFTRTWNDGHMAARSSVRCLSRKHRYTEWLHVIFVIIALVKRARQMGQNLLIRPKDWRGMTGYLFRSFLLRHIINIGALLLID